MRHPNTNSVYKVHRAINRYGWRLGLLGTVWCWAQEGIDPWAQTLYAWDTLGSFDMFLNLIEEIILVFSV